MSYRQVKNPTEMVVIFKTHLREDADEEEYDRTCRRMHELVDAMPGFVSIKGYRAEDGEEIDIVRFRNDRALAAWRNEPEHRRAQERGRREFYDRFSVQACKVVREYEFSLEPRRTNRRARNRTRTSLS